MFMKTQGSQIQSYPSSRLSLKKIISHQPSTEHFTILVEVFRIRVQMTIPLTSFQLNICRRQWVLGLCFAFKQNALTEWKNPWLPLNSTALEPCYWTPLNKTSEQVWSSKTVWNEHTAFHIKRFSFHSLQSHDYGEHRKNISFHL